MASNFLPAQSVSNSFTDGGNPFEQFFGPPPGQVNVDMDPYRKRSYTHFALPDAYQGRNYFLGTAVQNEVMSEDSYYTQTLLPIKQLMDGEVPARGVSWNKWTFGNHMADILPEETPATLLESRRESSSRSFVRFGKAFRLEHGFMMTPEGQESYRRKLIQMINLVLETTNFDVIYEILNVDIHERAWNSRFGFVRQSSVENAIEEEKRRWAILQKTKNGFEKMDATVASGMRKNRGTADTWILHENMFVWLRLTPAEKTDHYLAGERGPNSIANLDATKPVGFLNQTARVFLSRAFAAGDNNSEIDPWLRERQIGEYFMLASEYQHNDDVSDYNTQEMNPGVYDEYIDDYSILSIGVALENSILFDARGHLRAPKVNFEVPNFQRDIRRDPFVKPSNPHGVEKIEVWGEMHKDYLPNEGVMRIARSAIRVLGERYQNGVKEISATLREGVSTLEMINNRPLSQSYLNKIMQGKQISDLVASVNDGRFSKSNARHIWPTEGDTGGFQLPALDNEEEKRSALVGFTNWPGLMAVRKMVRASSGRGYNQQELSTLDRLATLIEEIVQVARQIFPGSLFLDERFTAPQYGRMSSESVVLDNLLGMYQEALWLPQENQTARTGKEQQRIVDEDAELRQSIKPTAEQIGELSNGRFTGTTGELFGDSETTQNAIFGLPNANAKRQDRPFETLETRAIVADLYQQLNVFNQPNAVQSTDAAKPFLDYVKGKGRTPDQILDWATKNYKEFQTESQKAWKARIKRLSETLSQARNSDANLGNKTYADAVYGSGKEGENLPIGVEYAQTIAGDVRANPNAYFRTPLTLSAQQILKLAERPNDYAATVSRPSSNATVGASPGEVRMLAQQIQRASASTGRADISPTLSSLYVAQDLGHLQRTFVAQNIMERRKGDKNEGTDPFQTRRRMREDLVDRADRSYKRRKTKESGVGPDGGGNLDDALSFYDTYTGGDAGGGGGGRGLTGTDTVQTQMVAQGNDGIEDGAGYLSEVHDRFSEQYRLVQRGSDSEAVKLFAKFFLGTPTTRQSLQAMARNNVVLPLVYMAARPHMRYNMRMGVKMLAGAQTGNTFVGQSFFELGDNTQIQMHEANYRWWSKSVIINPENVSLVFDIFSQEGLGGAGTQPISLDHYDPSQQHFGRDSEESIFYIPLPYSAGVQSENPRQQLPSTLDLSGRFLHYKILDSVDQEKLMNLQYSTAARMNAYIGWRTEEAYGSVPLYDTYHPWRFENNDLELHYNTVVCRGHQVNWNRVDKKRTNSTRNTGHWGPLTVPGVAEIRNGGYKELRDIYEY